MSVVWAPFQVTWWCISLPFRSSHLRAGAIATWSFLSKPVQAGALCCFILAIGLTVVWAFLAKGLDLETRPSPVRLAELTAVHGNIFTWTGVAWVAVHTLALPIVVALFLVHADAQRPSLWAFSVFLSLTILFWTFFGAMSIPLGASTGPQYADALNRAALTDDQRTLWNTRCTVDAAHGSAPSVAADEVAAACASAGDEPLLMALYTFESNAGMGVKTAAVTGLRPDQVRQLDHAFGAALDGWVVRKVSDTLYFAGNATYVLALFFFCLLALSSRVIRSFSITTAIVSALAYLVGFTAFWWEWGEWSVKLGIVTQGFLLLFIGADLWTEKERYSFAVGQPDTRPVRLLAREVPVTDDQIQWAYGLSDDWYRNRQITNTYARIASGMAAFCGQGAPPGSVSNANWFHFATWASKSVGERIWRRDLSQGPATTVEHAFDDFYQFAGNRSILSRGLAQGNRLVFRDTARMAVTLITTFQDATAADEPAWQQFEEKVRSWPAQVDGSANSPAWYAPPTTRGELLPALRAYYDARFASSETQRQQQILLGNLLLVRYEQRVLQDCVGDASGNFLRLFFVFIFPGSAVRIAAWGCALPLYGVRKVLAARAGETLSVSEKGAALEERWLRAVAGGIVGAANWMFGSEMDRLSASHIVLVLGSSKAKERLVVGEPLGFPAAGGVNVDVSAPPELGETWNGLAGDANEQILVRNYRNLDDRLRYIAWVFRRWQCTPVVREDPFSPDERRKERLVKVDSITRYFDAALPIRGEAEQEGSGA